MGAETSTLNQKKHGIDFSAAKFSLHIVCAKWYYKKLRYKYHGNQK